MPLPVPEELLPAGAVRRRDLLIVAAAAVAAWSPATTRAGGASRQAWPRGRSTPAVRLPALDGSTWDLAERRGHAVLVNFWASWCEPCRDEMPSLEALARRERTRGLVVVAANYREGEPAVRRFLASTSLELPVVMDRDGTTAKQFGVHAFPSTVAIDRQGRARFIVMGECDWTDARSRTWVDELLGGPSRL